ncbi:MAG: hypothetical protein WC640_02275 [Candidatus Paceibacterota bacterium]|jgi:hypothetical protein
MKTVTLHGSSGEVLAPFGEPGTFIRGKRQAVRIIGVGPDEETPLEVREALVGKVVDAILTQKQVIEQGGSAFADVLPEGCLLAYAQEVIELLETCHELSAAEALRNIAGADLDMYILEREIYEVIP